MSALSKRRFPLPVARSAAPGGFRCNPLKMGAYDEYQEHDDERNTGVVRWSDTIAQADVYPYRQPGPARDNVVRTLVDTCTKNPPTVFTGSQITTYCGCVANYAADVLTVEALLAEDRTGVLPDDSLPN